MILRMRYAHFSTSKLMSFTKLTTLAYPTITSEAWIDSLLEMKSLLASPRRVSMDDNFSRVKASTVVYSFYNRAD